MHQIDLMPDVTIKRLLYKFIKIMYGTDLYIWLYSKGIKPHNNSLQMDSNSPIRSLMFATGHDFCYW